MRSIRKSTSKGIGFLYPESHESKERHSGGFFFRDIPEAVITHNKETSWDMTGLVSWMTRCVARGVARARPFGGRDADGYSRRSCEDEKVFIGGDEVDVDRLRAPKPSHDGRKSCKRATDDPFQKEELRAKIKDVREAYEPAIAVSSGRSCAFGI